MHQTLHPQASQTATGGLDSKAQCGSLAGEMTLTNLTNLPCTKCTSLKNGRKRGGVAGAGSRGAWLGAPSRGAAAAPRSLTPGGTGPNAPGDTRNGWNPGRA